MNDNDSLQPLRDSFEDFMNQGLQALKKKELLVAMSNLTMAKQVSAKIAAKGKSLDKKMVKKLHKSLEKVKKKVLSLKDEKKSSFITRLRELGTTQAPETKSVTIFLFGLDRAGKTTFVEYLKNEKFKDHTPTLGVNVAHLVLGNVRLEFNDLGGQKAFRNSWMDYWNDQDLLIFMVDAADPDRFLEAGEALRSILDRPETANKPLLILANKIDLPTTKRLDIIIKQLGIHQLQNDEIGVFDVSVKEGNNLVKPLSFIASVALESAEMELFVTTEVYKSMLALQNQYETFIDQADELESNEKFQETLKILFNATMIQEELSNQGYSKARKESMACLKRMTKLMKKMKKAGITVENKWWIDTGMAL